MVRRSLAFCVAIGVILSASTALRAQGLSTEEDKTRIERLEKQIQMLTQQLQQIQVTPTSPAVGGAQLGTPVNIGQGAQLNKDEVKSIIDSYYKEKEDKKKAEDAAKKAKDEAEGYKVGTDLTAKVSWNDFGYLWVTTPNKDFTMHPGFWMQWDNVWWGQTPSLRTPPGARPGNKQGVASGIAANGIGNLEDGTYFRRIRPFVEGTLWENIEYRLILALENDQFSTSGLDEFWAGINNIPFIGTVRFGHVKTPMGFEGDMTASSRCMTFMERSSYSEAIEGNENFVTGVWVSNNYLDQHSTFTWAFFRQDQGASSGAQFGDGQYGAQGRLTALPYYDADGRCFLHLGLSGGWRNGTSNNATSNQRVFQLRARPELRDDDPAASGGQALNDVNDNRMVDTGPIAAERQWLIGLEFLQVFGPFSIQAEYGWTWIEDAVGIAPAGFAFNPKLTSPQNYVFSGGYVQLAYTLTGEARGYDKKYGTLNREYFGGKGVYNNAWLVWDENCGMNWNLGAWEIAARYSYLNLNDGAGLNRIQGGTMDGYTLGLNWYLNNNIKWQFDYVYDHRYALPVGTFGGYTSGFGTRLQVSF
jgi:phosphate-selective porin OprO/OprP